MKTGFSVTHNTASDYVKGAFTAVAAAVPLVVGAMSDGSFTGIEIVTVVGGVLLAFGAALGFYSKEDTDTTGDEFV